MTADDLIRVMEAMRLHGVAIVQAGEARLELGAQAPAATFAQALAMSRAQLADEQRRTPATVDGPEPRAQGATTTGRERVAVPVVPRVEADAPPTPTGPIGDLLGVGEDDPLLWGIGGKGEDSAG